MLCKHDKSGDVKNLTEFALNLLDGQKSGSSGWQPMTQEEIDTYVADSEAKAISTPKASVLTAHVPAEITGGKGEQTLGGVALEPKAAVKAEGELPPPATKIPKSIDAKDLANGQNA